MKLVILGGGGFRVPLVHGALANNALGGPEVDEVVLHDISTQRLTVIKKVIDDSVSSLADPRRAPRLRVTTDLENALQGADFVFAAIRVGGPESRVADERIALNLGLLGQETVGPGGLAYALRTIPVMDQVARTIARVAPNAWTINFTNPAGIVTQSMARVLGDRVVGICDTPIGLVKRVAGLLGADSFDFDYVGLNHLGWLRSVSVNGVDRLPELLADDQALDQLEEARLIGRDWVRSSGTLPNEYLYYYWHTDAAVARTRNGPTRGEYLARQQSQFYQKVLDPCCTTPFATWQATLAQREFTYMAEARDEERRSEDVAGGGYQEVALRLMSALSGGAEESMILNIANGATAGSRIVPELPDETMIEVRCRVSDSRVEPVPIKPVTLYQLGMMASLRSSEEAIAQAALSRDADLAWQGFATHPLVDSPRLGAELLAGYRAAHPQIDQLFGN